MAGTQRDLLELVALRAVSTVRPERLSRVRAVAARGSAATAVVGRRCATDDEDSARPTTGGRAVVAELNAGCCPPVAERDSASTSG